MVIFFALFQAEDEVIYAGVNVGPRGASCGLNSGRHRQDTVLYSDVMYR